MNATEQSTRTLQEEVRCSMATALRTDKTSHALSSVRFFQPDTGSLIIANKAQTLWCTLRKGTQAIFWASESNFRGKMTPSDRHTSPTSLTNHTVFCLAAVGKAMPAVPIDGEVVERKYHYVIPWDN